ncbi:DeoR family transcriptional regulator [Deinococcus wulumuqiensis]|uniref:DeoR family transcriptional regulator n=1 Tax=Deinococcus wulumuqiensis TaxID=980427 RepID=UPI00299001FE|nr:DeoR family transcriptional regulator [Deinococcus wulumuqiensis]
MLQLLAEHGTLRTTALTKLLGSSSATTRRDLDTLAGRGLIRKLHGVRRSPDRSRTCPGPTRTSSTGTGSRSTAQASSNWPGALST